MGIVIAGESQRYFYATMNAHPDATGNKLFVDDCEYHEPIEGNTGYMIDAGARKFTVIREYTDGNGQKRETLTTGIYNPASDIYNVPIVETRDRKNLKEVEEFSWPLYECPNRTL